MLQTMQAAAARVLSPRGEAHGLHASFENPPAPAELYVLLEAFYLRHNPSKIDTVPAIVRAYSQRVAAKPGTVHEEFRKLNLQLKKRYSEDLTSRTSATSVSDMPAVGDRLHDAILTMQAEVNRVERTLSPDGQPSLPTPATPAAPEIRGSGAGGDADGEGVLAGLRYRRDHSNQQTPVGKPPVYPPYEAHTPPARTPQGQQTAGAEPQLQPSRTGASPRLWTHTAAAASPAAAEHFFQKLNYLAYLDPDLEL
jgi:hypothetical protein